MADRLRERGVLISASVYVDGERVRDSGSGFVLDAGSSTVLVTSANWMRSVLSLRLDECTQSSSHLEWKVVPRTKFAVQYRPPGKEQLETIPAAISLVRLMPDVYHTVCSLWLETSPSVFRAQESRDGRVDESMQSLLYLSSVAVLKCEPNVFDSLSPVSLVLPSSLHSGHPLIVLATPFGDYFPNVFLNSVLSGCLSGCHGDGGYVFLTDAHCVQGCEGGLVHDGTLALAQGPVGMVGMVVSCLSGNGNGESNGLFSGMTLACSMMAVMDAVNSSHLEIRVQKDLFKDCPDTHLVSRQFPAEGSVLCVISGSSWASGVLLTRDVVLTCSHVLESDHDHVSVRWPGHAEPRMAKVIYSAPPTSAPDIALLRLSDKATCMSPNSSLLETPDNVNAFIKGTTEFCNTSLPVVAIGYCIQDPISSSGSLLPPLVTRGVVSNVIRCEGGPVMAQTSASVHRGMSGGLLCNAENGRPLGLLVSCARNEYSLRLLPKLGFALPFSWIGKPLLSFLDNGDSSDLQSLNNPEVLSLWKLRDYRTAFRSKL